VNESGYFVYLLVSDLDPNVGIGGLQCGIDYDAEVGRGIDVIYWQLCAAFQVPVGNWPEPGSGAYIVWNIQSTDPVKGCQRDAVAIAGYFYILTYGPDRLALGPLPSDGRVRIADCAAFPLEYDLTNHIPRPLGAVDIGGGPGWNSCQGDVPLPDFAIASATAAPLRISSAESVSLDAVVRNAGGGAAGPVAYTVTIDGRRVEMGPLPALAPSATASISTTVSGFAPGFRFLGVFADAEDNYGEVNEFNNFTGIPIQVDIPARVEPPELVYRLRGGAGSTITLALELDPPYDAEAIDARSVRLNGHPPVDERERVGDRDRDGITDMTLRFPGEAVTVGPGGGSSRKLPVEGILGDGNAFRGSLTLRIDLANRLSDSGESPVSAGDGFDGGHPFFVRPVSNPLRAGGAIHFGTETGGRVAVRVLDTSGRLVRTLVDADVARGDRAVRFDGRTDGGAALSSGVYFLELVAPEGRRVEKFVWRR
jgi:hypothetical protein